MAQIMREKHESYIKDRRVCSTSQTLYLHSPWITDLCQKICKKKYFVLIEGALGLVFTLFVTLVYII